ncbi:MBL fold metallo-hydrolase [Geobacter sulfurreducens]|uniref:MBL fold metallo-hydrolase n=1 Tax=Geobacter sulfurreducens TaxID=35554 RepID=UPI000DBB8F0F|nr:MBL fold metallo-hydrolase [Geobacter sulfurreducens]BBA69651.1 putative metallo-hydrolase [Geobacter sulfurreducens]
MIFETVVVGPLGVNCFILGCEQSREGVIVDPGAESGRILERVGELGLKVGMVINTHGHFDHVGGNRKVLEATGAKLLVHRDDVHFLDRAADVAAMYGLDTENSPAPDSLLEDGMTLSAGTLTLRVLHTPGHTPGGCCLLLEGEGMVLTGDTLFEESVGRTDFPGSSHEALITSIREKLLTLPDETEVYPGHGPATSIGRERRYNPYLTD